MGCGWRHFGRDFRRTQRVYFIGVILGTILLELIIKGRNIRAAFHAMLGALIGKVGGLTIKVIGTLTMVIVVGYKVFI